MSSTYLAPGVYVETLENTATHPIESLATSVLAIIGLYDPSRTEKGTVTTPFKPTLVTNWTQFVKMYGGTDQAHPERYLPQAIYGYFLNGGRQAYIIGLPVTSDAITPQNFKDDIKKGVSALEAYEDVTMLACPDVFAVSPAPPLAASGANQPEPGPNESADRSGPVLNDEAIKEIQQEMIDHCEKMGDRIALLDMKQNLTVGATKDWLEKTMKFDERHAAMYYPWIQVADGQAEDASRTNDTRPPIFIPPSGHIAGVFARVDIERGVHKAPANEVVRGAYSLEYNATRADQETLNQARVNCIRSFPGQGIRIWGARTLSTESQWRYINVQRLFANIGDSITHNTRWIVFEPNDPVLWAAIRRDISAYLTQLWRQGALFGRAPEEAFYVKCDAETNPPEAIDAGYCTVEVGIAPVKPAEFVVLRIGQWQGGSTTTAIRASITGEA